MVGEIRDEETASIAIHAALTGHLVITTLHTKDSISVIARLKDMGIPQYLIAETLELVIAQRLVRTRCAACGVSSEKPSDNAVAGTLCSRCAGSGFSGRTGLYEVLLMNDAIKSAIHERKSLASIEAVCRSTHFRSLYADGMKKVASGITTEAEIIHAVH
jgi:general secretion pathway protein E